WPSFSASGTMAVLKRVCDDRPRPIREVIREVLQWLCRVIEKLHAKDPPARYQSAREVADVLADCERQMKEHGGLRDLGRIPGGRPAPRRWRWVVAALELALAAMGGHAWITQNRPSEDTDRAAHDRAR